MHIHDEGIDGINALLEVMMALAGIPCVCIDESGVHQIVEWQIKLYDLHGIFHGLKLVIGLAIIWWWLVWAHESFTLLLDHNEMS